MSVDEPVALEPYDPSWPRQFEDEASRVRRALGNAALDIVHIGSTAVPGLPAKPIIDVMLGVAEPLSKDIVSQLGALGYEDCGHVRRRRYLRKRGGIQHFNIQVVQYKGRLWRENLVLRDYLRGNPDVARTYAQAKRLALRSAPMLLAYSRAKEEFIENMLRTALARNADTSE